MNVFLRYIADRRRRWRKHIFSCEGNEKFEIYKTDADEMNSDNSVKVADDLTYLLVNRAGLDILFK